MWAVPSARWGLSLVAAALVLVACLVWVPEALANTGPAAQEAAAQANAGSQPVGAAELKLLKTILTGNFGKAIGLIVVLMGVWRLTVNADAKSGILLIVLGVLIGLLPVFYNGLRFGLCPIVKQLGGSCGKAKV